MATIIYDAEVFPYNWMFGFKVVETGEIFQIWDDFKDLRRFMDTHKKDFFIGYNSKRYDDIILETCLKERHPYKISCEMIDEGKQSWSRLSYHRLDIAEGMASGTSLKSLQSEFGMSIEETQVDFHLDRPLTEEEIELHKDTLKKKNHENIAQIREIIKSYEDIGKIYLGGIPMIADDMMSYIKSDIVVFGIGVFIFIIITLWLIFRNIKWVIMPLLGCATSVIIMIGLLGLIGWKVTVISSNFIALMLILNMAMNIHLTVRFLQLKKELPQLPKNEAVLQASKKMMLPILYTVLTTICAFLSLSQIQEQIAELQFFHA